MPYDLVFLDPPYRLAPALGPRAHGAAGAAARAAGAHRHRERPPRTARPRRFRVTDERRYGDTLIRIHEHEPRRNRIAVCPGTYDPITNGHLDVITRAAELFDEVVVAVVNRPVRKGKTLFATEERIAFIEDATAHLPQRPREPFATLIVDFAREVGAQRDRQGPARDLRLRVRAGDAPAQPPAGRRTSSPST